MSRIFIILLLLPALMLPACSARKVSMVMTEKERQEAYRELAAGEKLVTYSTLAGKATRHGKVTAVVDAPIEKVWRVLTDYDNYDKFMPLIQKSRLIKAEGNKVVVRYQVGMTGVPITYNFNIYLVHDAARHEIRWFYAGGDINDAYGSWTLRPFGDGDRTLVTHTFFMDLSNTFGSPLAGLSVGLLLPQVIDSLRSRLQTASYRDWSPPAYAGPLEADPDDPFAIEFGDYD